MEVQNLTKPTNEFGNIISKEQPNPDNVFHKQLTLALEPEAAALYCKEDAQKTHHASQSASKYLVIDAGGGTLDITAHSLTSSKQIEVILPPCGNDAGGMTINDAFMTFLGELVEDKEFKLMLNKEDPNYDQYRTSLEEIRDEKFERLKTRYGDGQMNVCSVSIDLPFSFMYKYEKKLTENARKYEIDFYSSALEIKTQKFEMFYDPTLNKAMALITDVLTKNEFHKEIDAIFCVGGFGGCKIFHDRVTQVIKSINPDILIYRPENHSIAVVNGAVTFGKSPGIIKSRIAGATYGTSCNAKFDAELHSIEYRCYDDDNQPTCKHLFKPYIQIGDIVNTDYCLVSNFRPYQHNQKAVCFKLYRGHERDIFYTHDKHGEQIKELIRVGNLEMVLPDDVNKPPLDKKRKFELKFNFVHTEILVEAYDTDYDKRIHCTLDFLTK